MNLATRGFQILREKGLVAFAKKSVRFIGSQIWQSTVFRLYWGVKTKYDLSIDDTTVTFSAPTATVVRRNKGRYSSEYETLSEIIRELKTDDTFYDIGANTGLYSLFAAKNCSEVIAFEPYPPNLDLLKRDASRNELSNICVYEVALSDSEGQIFFNQPTESDAGYGSSSIVHEDDADSVLEIPANSGDNLITEDNLPTPNIVKIDVEGAEALVIEGLARSLSAPTCRAVYCEVHLDDVDHRPSISDFGADLEDIISRLREFGFTVEEIEARDTEVFLKGYK